MEKEVLEHYKNKILEGEQLTLFDLDILDELTGEKKEEETLDKAYIKSHNSNGGFRAHRWEK